MKLQDVILKSGEIISPKSLAFESMEDWLSYVDENLKMVSGFLEKHPNHTIFQQNKQRYEMLKTEIETIIATK